MKFVAYYRVSTKRQGESGLGLDGQLAAIEAHVQRYGGALIGSYTEVESGRRVDRAELRKALSHAKRSRATLVVAKLDRLARNVSFLSALLDAGIDFLACDNPHANRLTIQILAVIAEDEARRCSERTKAALQAYKARGGKLGAHLPQCRKLTREARCRGARRAGEVLHAMAQEAYQDISPLLKTWHEDGVTQQEIARKLESLGHTTRRGRRWSQSQVSRILRLYVLPAKTNSKSA